MWTVTAVQVHEVTEKMKDEYEIELKLRKKHLLGIFLVLLIGLASTTIYIRDSETILKGNLNMNDNRITNLASPSNSQDAVNKNWVEDYVSNNAGGSYATYFQHNGDNLAEYFTQEQSTIYNIQTDVSSGTVTLTDRSTSKQVYDDCCNIRDHISYQVPNYVGTMPATIEVTGAGNVGGTETLKKNGNTLNTNWQEDNTYTWSGQIQGGDKIKWKQNGNYGSGSLSMKITTSDLKLADDALQIDISKQSIS